MVKAPAGSWASRLPNAIETHAIAKSMAARPIVWRGALALRPISPLHFKEGNQMEMEVRITRYVMRFAIAYAAILIALAVASSAFGISSGAGSSLGALVAATVFAASKFVRDHRRVPSSSEKKRLTWSSLGMSVLVSAILVAAVIGATGQLGALVPMFSQVGVGLAVAVLIVVLLLQALVLWFSYGGFARLQYKSLKRRDGVA